MGPVGADLPNPRRVLERADLGIDGLLDAVEIGRGSASLVYRARQVALGRIVAVKMLAPGVTEVGRGRFEREGLALGRLCGHPHVVSVHGRGTARGGRPYLVMAYLRRGSLATQVNRRGPLPWPGAARIVIKTAGALESAHRLRMLHCDVKPHNILISDYGEPMLADFGVARLQGLPEVAATGVRGSVPFAAPELLEGAPASVASEVYALAATLYFLLAAEPPFAARAGELELARYLRIAADPPPELPPGVPPLLCEVIAAGLAKRVGERPVGAAEFGAALQATLAAAGQAGAEMALTAEPGPATDQVPEPAPAPHPSAGAALEGRTGARRGTVRRR